MENNENLISDFKKYLDYNDLKYEFTALNKNSSMLNLNIVSGNELLGKFTIGIFFNYFNESNFIIRENSVVFYGIFSGDCKTILRENSNIYYYVLYFLNRLNSSSNDCIYSISKDDDIAFKYQIFYHGLNINKDDIVFIFRKLVEAYGIYEQPLFNILYKNADPQEEFEKIKKI